MPDYIVTGKKGGGKTLGMVSRIREYVEAGRAVATNIDLNLAELVSKPPRARVLRVPDRPNADDIQAIGVGNETTDEDRNGGIFLDEAGTWLNSRQWSDKGRTELLDLFLHLRKLGWDLYIGVQALSLLDKQFREALGEYIVVCRRLDRLKIPVFGRVIQAVSLGYLSGNAPKVHVAAVRYGTGPASMHADTWIYRGRDLYKAYNTRQLIGVARVPTFAMVWRGAEPVVAPGPKPKLRAVQLAASLPRDQAWAISARYVSALSALALAPHTTGSARGLVALNNPA